MTPLIAAFHWNHDGLLLDLGFYAVRWYGLMWLGGFLIGLRMFHGFCRREERPIDQLDGLFLATLAGAMIGARLGHVLFYRLDYFLRHPLEIFLIWHGGLASHGGMIGILVAVWLWSRRRPEFGYLWTLDRIAVPTALAGAMIRIGNFFNSEILGRASDSPWAVVFERAPVPQVPRHPVMLYEATAYLLSFLALRLAYRRWTPSERPGRLLGLFLILVFSARFAAEPFKLRQAAFAQDWPLSVGQCLSIVPVVVGLALLFRPAPDLQERNRAPAC
ncbi:MAG: prolipoprotein diacylglyceryl transferase [Thermoanaerobaculia bacterium]|nr:prolipoprotein diacylglyceryl transferase [Thermoanaerobaculia bacterium]